MSYKNPELDEIIEELRGEYDEDRRIELFHRFHRILADDQAYTFLYISAELIGVHKRFQGVEAFPLRPGYDLREWWVPKDQQLYR